MWHPFLGSSASANDLELDEQTRVYFVTGLGPSLFECDFSTSLPIYRAHVRWRPPSIEIVSPVIHPD